MASKQPKNTPKVKGVKASVAYGKALLATVRAGDLLSKVRAGEKILPEIPLKQVKRKKK